MGPKMENPIRYGGTSVAFRAPRRFAVFFWHRVVCVPGLRKRHSDNTRNQAESACSAPRILWRRVARRALVRAERRVPVCMMLADRRVARTGRRRPLSSYARPLCLIAFVLLDPASATAVPLSISGVRRGRPRVSVVGSGGGDVGVAVATPWGIPSKVWTAVLAAAAVQDDGWSSSSSRLVPTTAMAFADPSSVEATARERARRLLASVRGGSEGLKSEAWNREKAAEGEARARGAAASGGVGEVCEGESVCVRISLQ